MSFYGYIMVDSCIISFNFNCIMQLKQFYNIVSSRKKTLLLLVIYVFSLSVCLPRTLVFALIDLSLRLCFCVCLTYMCNTSQMKPFPRFATGAMSNMATRLTKVRGSWSCRMSKASRMWRLYSRVGNSVPMWNVSFWLLWRVRCD